MTARMGVARKPFEPVRISTSYSDRPGDPEVREACRLYAEANHGIGFTLGYEFDHAPVIDNLTGDTHASGGHRLSTGVSYAY